MIKDLWTLSPHLNLVLINNHILLCPHSSIDLNNLLVMMTRERRSLASLRINENPNAALMKLERGKIRR